MKVTLINPAKPAGSDIIANFVPRGDEKRDKEDNVINAERIVFAAGTQMETDEKTAQFILKTWGFVQKGRTTSTEPVTETFVVDEGVDTQEEEKTPEIEDNEEEIAEEEDLDAIQEEFDKLKAIGWVRLKGKNKDRYKELKEKLGL